MSTPHIADVYRVLDDTHRLLNMDPLTRQHQITVYGRVPFMVHPQSSGVDKNGEFLNFKNNGTQVTVRLGQGYCAGTIGFDSEEQPDNRIALLADDRRFKSIVGGKLENFVPKEEGEYEITEAFQTLRGNFTTGRDRTAGFLWDYVRMVESPEFTLHEYLDQEAFGRFADRVRELNTLVKQKEYPNAVAAIIDIHDRKPGLHSLIDCAWPAHSDRTFYTWEEAVREFASGR